MLGGEVRRAVGLVHGVAQVQLQVLLLELALLQRHVRQGQPAVAVGAVREWRAGKQVLVQKTRVTKTKQIQPSNAQFLHNTDQKRQYSSVFVYYNAWALLGSGSRSVGRDIGHHSLPIVALGLRVVGLHRRLDLGAAVRAR